MRSTSREQKEFETIKSEEGLCSGPKPLLSGRALATAATGSESRILKMEASTGLEKVVPRRLRLEEQDAASGTQVHVNSTRNSTVQVD